jgi:endonuclease/exonuclease/phosphatase family metal-dependent hydrolase
LVIAALLAMAMAPAAPQPPANDVSIMAYNVHGLPWPFARGRPDALKAIAARLADMRSRGSEPHLVLLQEAFTGDAKAIGREAGYAYCVTGPGRGERAQAAGDLHQQQFARAGRWIKGEGDGTLEDSGLLILSDYPVIDVQRMPYSRFACAGFDCLANKGILLVRVAVPGMGQPLTVVDTHMNSRGASGVSHSRADTAFGWQAAQLRDFVAANVPSSAPAVVAGDFNVGKAAYRRAMIGEENPVLPGAGEALRTAFSANAELPQRSDAAAIVASDKDWMFVRSGAAAKLDLQEVAVPFGHEANGKSLSDHFGYVSYYSVERGAR